VRQQASEGTTGRTLRIGGVGQTVPHASAPASWSQQRPRPSARRFDEERERRHRERTIAAWLRSLSR
jgi:hypothetical protein